MRTVMEPPMTKVNFELPFCLNPDTALLVSAGSCFAENVTEILSSAGIKCERNPNGIVYNPYSLFVSFQRIVMEVPYTENDFFEYNGLWHSWNHHGSFSFPTLKESLELAEFSRLKFAEYLRKADLVVLTPASASVFELVENQRIVANCHKLPGNLFRRRMLTYAECLSSLNGIVSGVKLLNPGCRIVFTLSPVRHNPGDLVANARSKALLLSAIHDCAERNKNVFYFPAYEIVLDELRDYRFFKDDMCHPNEIAVDIVARTFAAACFGEKFLSRIDEAEKRKSRSLHIEMRKN